MAVIGHYPNRTIDGKVTEMVLIVDAAVVGTISLSPDGDYRVSTKGMVPALDGIGGASFKEVWAKIADRVRSGGVYFTRLITDVKEANRI